MSPLVLQILPVLAAALLACLLGGLLRVLRGPTRADRMMAAQLLGTTAVAILIVMAVATGQRALLDVALALAILAAVTVVAFVVTGGRNAP